MIGRLLGSYRIVDKLGEGGMGAVYLAEHQRISRRAAIKVLRPELAHREMLVERFFTEARATSLIRHPGIVEVFDCAVEEGCVYIVMEFLEGEPLSGHLRRLGPRLENGYLAAVRIAEEIASAVAAAHAQQIVHRDLKPDNVFLARSAAGQVSVKILDFGIAKLVAGEQLHQTSTGAMLGTPIYMSPEQCRGAGKVDARTDVYALGCILHELVSGHPPFLKEGAGELISAHLNEAPAPLSTVAPAVPPALEALVLSMLAKAPEERPATMLEVAARLRALRDPALDGQPLPISPPAVTGRTASGALAPTAVLPGSLAATEALPSGPVRTGGSLPPQARTAVLPTSERRNTTLGASAHAFDAKGATQPIKRGRRGWLGLGGLALAGGVVAAFQLLPARRPVAPTPAVSPPVIATPPRGLPPLPPPEEWVTIELDGAPSGAAAVVDGKPEPLPLRLPRGASPRMVRFEAPGHQPRTVLLDGSRDRSLLLDWVKVSAPPRPPRKKERPATPAQRPPQEPGPASSPLDMKLQ
jgi:serine/threonine protein kinase